MKLTPELLEKVKAVVQKHHAAFAVGVFGPDVVPNELLEQLKAEGLIEDVENTTEFAYLYGQLVAKLQDPSVIDMTLDQVAKELEKNPIPLTTAEQQAIQTAKLTAGTYITGLSGTVVKEVGGMLQTADHVYRAKVRQGVGENIATRATTKQLKSDLGWATKDWTRNLDRVAITEKHNAMQEGVADGFRKRFGDDARVSIRPMPDACKHCKKLHLGPDGMPRIFKLSQLAPPGANVGKKASEWVPTVGSVHPHCQCQLIRVPVGWGYDEDGTLVPGGEFGVEFDGDDFGKALEREEAWLDELTKAYKLEGEIDYQGLDIAVETGSGNLRFWKDHKAGETGATVMQWPYGYIRGTLGVDGDHVDCYVGPNPDAKNAYVVHQRKKMPDDTFRGYDEDKVMLGFSSLQEARAAYLAHYDDKRFLDSITTMPVDELKAKLEKTRARPRKLTKSEAFGIPNPDYVEPRAQPDARFVINESELAKGKQQIFYGPKGGKYLDPQHKVPYKEGATSGKTKRPAEPGKPDPKTLPILTSDNSPIRMGELEGLPGTYLSFLPGKRNDGWAARHRRDLGKDLDAVKARGVTHVLDLTEGWEPKEYADVDRYHETIAEKGMEVWHEPIVDRSVPPWKQAIDIVRKAKEIRAQGGQVLVHCMGGLGRTGVIAGMMLAAEQPGISGDEIIKRLQKARGPNAPDTAAQAKRIKDFAGMHKSEAKRENPTAEQLDAIREFAALMAKYGDVDKIPDELQKGGPHKYIKKEKKGDKWIYTYAEEHGGKVRPHKSDPGQVMIKLPKAKAGTLQELAKKHGLGKVIVGDKYAMVGVKVATSGTPKPAAKKQPKKAPTVQVAKPKPTGPFNAGELQAKLSELTGHSPEKIQKALSGSAKPGSTADKVRKDLEQAVLSNGLERKDALLDVLAHDGHSVAQTKATLKGITKGDLNRAAKEYEHTPSYDLEILGKVTLYTSSISGYATCNMSTRELRMGPRPDKGDYATGDFRHELGHAVHGHFMGGALDAVVNAGYKDSKKRAKAKPPTGSGKMDSNWYEEEWGVTGKRGMDNAKEYMAEHYRCYHRTLHQERTAKANPKGSSSLAQYRERHPEMAKLMDARYTVALLGLEAKS